MAKTWKHAGACIRWATPDDAEGIARVHVDSWRATYRGFVRQDILDGLSYPRWRKLWQGLLEHRDDGAFVFVAEASGRIVGFVSGGRNRSGDPAYEGSVRILYLLESHQRRGLGRRLMRSAAEYLASHGVRSLQVWVREGTRAAGFYEALRGQRLRTTQFDLAKMPWLSHVSEPVVVTEIEYGWPDITVLMAP